ncbi:Suppressor of fused protein (SUFU) [compost metagenome]
MSDDFEDEESGNGFGIELYVESNAEELINMPMEQLNNTWLFQLLFQAACNAAQSGAYYNAVNTYGVVSSEFWDIDLDDRYMTENESVGVLIGIEHENRPSSMTFENDKILMVSVTAIKPEELNAIVANGRAYRDQLAKMLQDQNRFNVIDLNRETL